MIYRITYALASPTPRHCICLFLNLNSAQRVLIGPVRRLSIPDREINPATRPNWAQGAQIDGLFHEDSYGGTYCTIQPVSAYISTLLWLPNPHGVLHIGGGHTHHLLCCSFRVYMPFCIALRLFLHPAIPPRCYIPFLLHIPCITTPHPYSRALPVGAFAGSLSAPRTFRMLERATLVRS